MSRRHGNPEDGRYLSTESAPACRLSDRQLRPAPNESTPPFGLADVARGPPGCTCTEVGGRGATERPGSVQFRTILARHEHCAQGHETGQSHETRPGRADCDAARP